jgi:acyl carrier protein
MALQSAPVHHATRPVTTAQLRELLAAVEMPVKLNQLKDKTLFKDAGADSLDFFNLIVAVEDAYGIIIPSDHLGQVNTLDGLARYLNERLP